MDLKFLSLIVLIMLITFYFINEFKSLKASIANSNENVNKLLKSKFNVFVNEVKDINTDLVNQTKKISKIHSQKITNMSNYFTESESEGKNVINYLSDTKNNDKIFKIEFNENDSKKNSARNSAKNNTKTNDNDIVSKNSKLKTLSVTSQDDISHDDNTQEDRRLSQQTSSCADDDVVGDRDDQESEHGTEEITEFAKYNDNNKNDEVSTKSKSNTSVNDSSKKQSDKRSHGHDESQSSKSSENRSNDIKIESVKLTTLNNDLNNHLNNDTISVESREIDMKSLHDMISFGSKKSKGSKLKIEVGNNHDDKKSLDSAEIKNITTLEYVDKYSKKTLDNIARVLNVSNFYKDGTKRILYKKEELYLKIKEEINKKSNQ